MTKLLERHKAIELRKAGKSYREIRKELRIGKSSLSLWLRHYPLTSEQIQRFKDARTAQIERYILSMREKRLKRLEEYYTEQKRNWLPLSQRELFLAGIFLYWGEGEKASRHTVSINNTDPMVMKFALFWLTKALGFPKDKVKASVHLYDDMNIDEEVNYWSNTLGLPKEQFTKPYIKRSQRVNITQKGFGHGTCVIRICHTPTKERILMSIKAISENLV